MPTSPTGPPELMFQERTQQSGIDFAYSNGRADGEFAILESLGGGLGVLDYDRDGLYDLMFAGGGSLANKTVTSAPSAMYRNLGGWRFEQLPEDCAGRAQAFFTHGIYPGDWDADGFDDLAISGYGGVQLLHNNGDGTFTTWPALISHQGNDWSSSLAWADYDGDGQLDLYVAHYVDWSWSKHPVCAGTGDVTREVCAPREFTGQTDVLYFGDGQGGFRAVATEIGLVVEGKGLGVVAADVNMDSHVDLYVANDTTDNFLYINDGTGRFKEAAVLSGVSGDDAGISTGSMGVCAFDATGDQLPDIWVANFQRELFALYRGEGSGQFTYASRQMGLAAIEPTYVGFGTVPIDYDVDGDIDLVVANGHVSYASPYAAYRQAPLLFENLEGKRFRKAAAGGYFAEVHTGRGLAYVDLDNNGLMDLAVSHLEEPVSILSAPAPKQTTRQPHLLELVGRRANRNAIGATLILHTKLGQQLLMNNGGGSYLSASDPRIACSLPVDDDSAHIVVTWPGGNREKFSLAAQPLQHLIVEGLGQPLGN
ncbi:MAG: CRTAC1 family protein [Pirellulaceae bacterium]|nr:CRTAC1 family protein [Pirellulaceae bacterium]